MRDVTQSKGFALSQASNPFLEGHNPTGCSDLRQLVKAGCQAELGGQKSWLDRVTIDTPGHICPLIIMGRPKSNNLFVMSPVSHDLVCEQIPPINEKSGLVHDCFTSAHQSTFYAP